MVDDKSDINRAREKIQLFTRFQIMAREGEGGQSEHVILQAAAGMFDLIRHEVPVKEQVEFDEYLSEARNLQNASMIKGIANAHECRNKAYYIGTGLVKYCTRRAHELGWDSTKSVSSGTNFEAA